MSIDRVGLCRFGSGRVAPLFRALKREIPEVRKGSDPEHLHRMRVASRRLRIALPLFRSCFQKTQYRKWLKGLREVSRALGTARDTDVQILFLDTYVRDHVQNHREINEIARMRMFLEKRRKRSHTAVLSALGTLEREGVLREVFAAIKSAGSGGRVVGRERPEETMGAVASNAIETAWGRFLSHGNSIQNPEDVAGHHALRISTKKLRYTLEVFRPVFPDRLRPALTFLKHLQEILGELHDCDVWIQLLSDPRSATAGSGAPPVGSASRFSEEMNDGGVPALLQDRKEAREELFGQLAEEWEKSVEAGLKEYLPAAIRTQQARIPEPEVREPSGLLAESSCMNPKLHSHERQVTELALQLFDQLSPLHDLGIDERRILKYAGQLHDIGWIQGKKGHHVRSGRMILADTTLPLKRRDREMIALIARYHRKKVPARPPRAFSRLKQKDLRRVLLLASLLRIADGLDYTQTNRVVSVSCAISRDSVTCRPVYDGDGTAERSRALEKADLFEQVFSRRFLIP